MQLRALERRLEDIAKREDSGADQELGVLVCHEALDAAREGNYGVGAVLLSPDGQLLERGHNSAFEPTFRSDLHAEMVVMNAFEQHSRDAGQMRGYTLISSLEPCPMCLSRLLISGVETVKFLAKDALGGMVTRLQHLPEAWQRLAARQRFELADVSEDLRELSLEIFLLNLERLRTRLWSR